MTKFASSYRFFPVQEEIRITRSQFETSIKELNLFVKDVGVEAITYEYTSWLDPNDTKSMIDALDLMVGDYQFTCPTVEFADRYVLPICRRRNSSLRSLIF